MQMYNFPIFRGIHGHELTVFIFGGKKRPDEKVVVLKHRWISLKGLPTG